MLVAKQQQYSYNTEYNNRQSNKPKEAISPKKRNRVKPIMVVLCIFMLASLYVSRQVTIAAGKYELSVLREELELQQRRTQHNEYNMLRSEDLQQIEKIAIEELGMQYPNSSQVVSISIPDRQKQNDQMDVAANTRNNEEQRNGLIKLLYSLLD